MRRHFVVLLLLGCGTSGASMDASTEAGDAGADADAGKRDASAKDSGADEPMDMLDAGLNNCGDEDFVDLGAPDADRTIIWELTVKPRCVAIATGESVTWQGSLVYHPITTKGGDMPSPIVLTSTGNSVTFDFLEAGDFGYVCVYHPPMQGVIRVR